MGRLSENSVVNIKNKSFAVTSELEVPARGAEGVIIAQGGRFGGWSLYAKDGKAKFHYNVLGIKSFDIEATEPIPAGKTRCAWSSPTTAAAWARAATSRSTTTARKSARAASTRRRRSSSPRTRRPTSAARPGTTVSPDYTAHTSKFNGKINWVQIDLGDDDRRPLHRPRGAIQDRHGAAVAPGRGRRPSVCDGQQAAISP